MSHPAELGLVVAIGPDQIIGRNGQLPWHEPDDLNHFKTVTDGHTLIVGRGTYDSLPRVLPGRRFVVVTRHPDTVAPHPNVVCASDPNTAVTVARGTDPKPIVAGGAAIYTALFPHVTWLTITRINTPDVIALPADTRLAAFDLTGFRQIGHTTLSPGVHAATYRRH